MKYLHSSTGRLFPSEFIGTLKSVHRIVGGDTSWQKMPDLSKFPSSSFFGSFFS
jgi:hypothetical protein